MTETDVSINVIASSGIWHDWHRCGTESLPQLVEERQAAVVSDGDGFSAVSTGYRRTIAVSLLKAKPDCVRLKGPTTPTVNAVRYDGVTGSDVQRFASSSRRVHKRLAMEFSLKRRDKTDYFVSTQHSAAVYQVHKHCSQFYHAKWLTLDCVWSGHTYLLVTHFCYSCVKTNNWSQH